MITPLVALPVRSFSGAKDRLGTRFDAPSRARIARALASRTAEVVSRSGVEPLIVSSGEDVAKWATENDLRCLPEPASGGLNAAASVAPVAAGTEPWLILHADLPCLSVNDLTTAYIGLNDHPFVVAPSHDGGTTAIGGRGSFEFSYGPASFHRHLRAAPGHLVVSSFGFLLDVDSVADIDAATNHPRGAWLKQHLDAQGGFDS